MGVELALPGEAGGLVAAVAGHEDTCRRCSAESLPFRLPATSRDGNSGVTRQPRGTGSHTPATPPYSWPSDPPTEPRHPHHRVRGGRRRVPDRAGQRSPGGQGGVRHLRTRGRLGVRGHRRLGVGPRAAEPHRHAARRARLRVAAVDAGGGQLGVPLHDRADARRRVGRGLPAPRPELPDRQAGHAARPRDRHRGLRHLPARVRAGDVLRQPGGARLPGLPAEPALRRARREPGQCAARARPRALRLAVSHRARARHAALAARLAVPAPAADARSTRRRCSRSCSSSWPRPAPATPRGGPRSSPPGSRRSRSSAGCCAATSSTS